MKNHILISSLFLALIPLSGADATELRFSETAAGSVIATGNTLGLSKASTGTAPGVEDSIGAFITLDAASTHGDYAAGTTGDWAENGSEATLALPSGAEVLYAELVWGGSYNYSGVDVSAALDDAVLFEVGGDSYEVDPDDDTALTLAETSTTTSGSTFPVNYYVRSADVTSIVAQHGAGVYSTSSVPGTAGASNTLNAAGWTLIVAYRDRNEPIRNLTVFVGGEFVDENATVDYDVDGFCTPPTGPFEGYVVVTAMEGDANRSGDGLEIAQTDAGTFVALEASNNPADNFFASQINGSNGDLDTSGSFGSVNHNAFTGENVVGGRQGWDITRAPISSDEGHLANGQTSAVLRAFTTGDSFLPTAVAFSIGVNAPNFAFNSTSASASPATIDLDEVTEVTVTLSNDGLVDATGVVFKAPVPAGLSLEGFTLDGVDGDDSGNAVTAASLGTGVGVGSVAAGATRTIVLSLRATDAPAGDANRWVISPSWQYDYVSCVGEVSRNEPFGVDDVIVSLADEVDEPDTGDDGEPGDGSGDQRCGCAHGSPPALGWVALLGLLALRRRR